MIDGRAGKSILLAKKLSSASISGSSSSSFPSTRISTSLSSVPFISSSSSSSSSSDDLLTPLLTSFPKPIGMNIAPLPTPPSTRSPSPEPRIETTKHVHFQRRPPKQRSPSPFIRSPSPSRLPTRIEPMVLLPPPTIPEINKDEYFPLGSVISKKIDVHTIQEDCNYLNQWKKGIETGSGEAGKTRIVRHKNHGYNYVLKSQRRGGQFTSQFRAEIQALLELQGTDLVPKIYDVWTCRTMGYIIMEQLYNCDHIDKQELYQKVREKLRHLRNLGWLHVDTHDGNVMCTSSGEPVIIDFGYAVKIKADGDNAVYPEHPKSQPINKNGWGVALPWKFLEVMQQVNFHESFNPYGSKDRNIKRQATMQNEIDYKNMQKKYKDAQQNLRVEFGYRYAEDVLDEMSKSDRLYGR